jgi:formate-dependent nitrite reductase membrane component NrfD
VGYYLFLAGMSGGAYFSAFLVEHFSGESGRRLLRVAACLGIPLAGLGVLLLVVDLGEPLRFWHLLLRFELLSAMSMGTWILTAFVIAAGAIVVLWVAELRLARPEIRRLIPPATNALAVIGFVLAMLLMVYTGVLLATTSRPLWAGTVLLPPLFVASATSTGLALLIVATATIRALGIHGRTVSLLAEADAVVILVELTTLLGYALALGESTMPGALEGLRLITTGALAMPFWVGVVLLALLVPLQLEVSNWGRGIEIRSVWRAITLSSGSVLVGGLILRAVIVIGGQA